MGMSGIPLFSLRWDKYLDKIMEKVKTKLNSSNQVN